MDKHKKRPGTGRRPISLVTGGAGFIGSHVAEELLKMGHKVVILDDFSGGRYENITHLITKYNGKGTRISVFEASILDKKLVNNLFMESQFDYVYHLAAYAAEGLSHHIRNFNYQNNLIGSVNLINAAVNTTNGRGVRTCKCFVFTSSIAVYGHVPPEQLPVTEETPCNPADPYGIAKLAVEQDLKAAHKYYGLPYIIFRPHNVYGERQNIWDKYRNVVGIFMRQMLQGEPFTIFGDGKQRRAFSYIKDVAPAIAYSTQVPQAYNEIFNVGSDWHVSINELAIKIGEERWKRKYLPERNEVVNIYSSNKKIRDFLRYNHNVWTLENGLKRMWEWAQKQQVGQPTKKFKKIEIQKNLPESWK